jgi:rhomboid family GlyGly-CTERM serine protease
MIRDLSRRFPVTITVSLLVLLIHFVPAFNDLLQFDFDAVASGQWWRIWTGHLTHFGSEHLFWDLLMFIGLAGACEQTRSRQMVPALALMAGGISLAVQIFCVDVTIYRGLSGIDTGLFVWFAGMRLLKSVDNRDPLSGLLWAVPFVGLIGKLLFEAATGQTLFVDSTNFVPLVESHLAGVVIGILLCLYGRSANSAMMRHLVPAQ